MKPLLILSIPLLLFMGSCRENRQQAKIIQRIDSLFMVVDTAKNVLAQIDTGLLRKEAATIDSLSPAISDKIDSSKAIVIRQLELIKKSFNDCADLLPSLKNEIDYSEVQLRNLKKDIEKGYTDPEQAESYYRQEKQALKVVWLKIQYYNRLTTSGHKQLEELISKGAPL